MTPGFGSPFAARRVKWLAMPLGIGVNGRASDCGGAFQTSIGKETGETAHVERWNNTLRQRLARFVRMTLSFSKSAAMHEMCLLLFLYRYNLDRAILLK